ncbi:protein CLT1, chloroplastic-like isoform X2 [Vicia villosa]|uniref:protein CLT1, chloroplastic-like isoform X2 n=1 Tax=Vicia villosa TaxID=3911 RepID=UPI00273CC482|nr:protein CLT1, chloroplastic-like isoform X2 [Vicia villosa]
MASLCRRLPAAGTATSTVTLFGQVRLLQPTKSASIYRIRYGYSLEHPGVVLQLRRRSWTPVVEAIGNRDALERSDFSEEDEKEMPHSLAEGNSRKDVNQAVKVVVAAAAVVATGVGNRVLYKLALVPLKQYPFFLAQISTFVYVVVYFSILYIRYRAGIVTDEMLSMPKTPFLIVGLLEALGAATGMAAGAMLSGASIPILSQTFLVWQILLSTIFLGRRYKVNQLLGCFLVAIGVIITVASGSGAGKSLQEAGIFWSLLMMTSFLFQAADTVLKEVIFMDAARKLKGGSLDLFVVNSFGSAFQCRHCLYASSSPSYQNYGASLSVNCQTTLKMVQPAF